MTPDPHPTSEQIAAWIDGSMNWVITLHLAGCMACCDLVAEVRASLAEMNKDDEEKDAGSRQSPKSLPDDTEPDLPMSKRSHR